MTLAAVGLGLQAVGGLFSFSAQREATQKYNEEALMLYGIATQQTMEQVRLGSLRIAVQRRTEQLSEAEAMSRIERDLAIGLSEAAALAGAGNLSGTTVNEARGAAIAEASEVRAGLQQMRDIRDAAAQRSQEDLILRAEQALLQARPVLQDQPDFLSFILGLGGSLAGQAGQLYGGELGNLDTEVIE